MAVSAGNTESSMIIGVGALRAAIDKFPNAKNKGQPRLSLIARVPQALVTDASDVLPSLRAAAAGSGLLDPNIVLD